MPIVVKGQGGDIRLETKEGGAIEITFVKQKTRAGEVLDQLILILATTLGGALVIALPKILLI